MFMRNCSWSIPDGALIVFSYHPSRAGRIDVAGFPFWGSCRHRLDGVAEVILLCGEEVRAPYPLLNQASNSGTTSAPVTKWSVSDSERPLCRKVSSVWSRPN